MDRRARRPVGLAMTILFVSARSERDDAIHAAVVRPNRFLWTIRTGLKAVPTSRCTAAAFYHQSYQVALQARVSWAIAPPLDPLPVQGEDGCWVRRQSSVLSRQVFR